MARHAITRGELLNLLEDEVKKYRREAISSVERNRHMNDLSRTDLAKLKKNRRLIQKTIDALLVDFINNIGIGQCLDYGLYTKDLKSKANNRA